jgi:nitronate monooxygenase
VPPDFDAAREARWKEPPRPYYAEHGLNPDNPRSNRGPFTAGTCAIVEEFKPEVVSLRFGLAHEQLLERVKRTGSKVIASATTAR